MLKDYQTKTGIYFSLFVALMGCIPKLISLDAENFHSITATVTYVFFSLLICWYIHQTILNYQFKGATIHQSRLRFFSILVGIFVVILISLLYKEIYGLYFFNGKILTNEQMLLSTLFRSTAISSFCFFAVFYLNTYLMLQTSRLENEYLKQEQLRAQLILLKQQLSPHFLFNSLSTLRTIAPNQETKNYVTQLANVYRYLLTSHDQQKITLKEEVEFTRSYLYILQERFEEALQITININEELLNYRIPPVSLQILLENSIKHNIISMDDPLQIRIYTDDLQQLVVTNTFQPKKSVEDSNGKGLQNINERYKLLAGKEISVINNNAFFTVTLPLLKP
ncbi:sensor histidine kinase [Pedobacter sp. L105]|uniref:sensor histidine kinase n=1 Tax=Pedobacter sp. L105 TaxID=1641871 RepID=UPI00131AA57C|nr:histidine kinase [Pedobacter sp. L105]